MRIRRRCDERLRIAVGIELKILLLMRIPRVLAMGHPASVGHEYVQEWLLGGVVADALQIDSQGRSRIRGRDGDRRTRAGGEQHAEEKGAAKEAGLRAHSDRMASTSRQARNDSCRHSHRGRPIGHILQHHGIRANARIVADSYPPKTFAPPPTSTLPPKSGARSPSATPMVACCRIMQFGPISLPGWMTMPLGWGIMRPPLIREFSGMSAPVTMLQKRCRSTATFLQQQVPGPAGIPVALVGANARQQRSRGGPGKKPLAFP